MNNQRIARELIDLAKKLTKRIAGGGNDEAPCRVVQAARLRLNKAGLIEAVEDGMEEYLHVKAVGKAFVEMRLEYQPPGPKYEHETDDEPDLEIEDVTIVPIPIKMSFSKFMKWVGRSYAEQGHWEGEPDASEVNAAQFNKDIIKEVLSILTRGVTPDVEVYLDSEVTGKASFSGDTEIEIDPGSLSFTGKKSGGALEIRMVPDKYTEKEVKDYFNSKWKQFVRY